MTPENNEPKAEQPAKSQQQIDKEDREFKAAQMQHIKDALLDRKGETIIGISFKYLDCTITLNCYLDNVKRRQIYGKVADPMIDAIVKVIDQEKAEHAAVAAAIQLPAAEPGV